MEEDMNFNFSSFYFFFKLRVYTQEDYEEIMRLAFYKFTRQEQRTYRLLEPLGFNGVWGLDDFQFLPFVFGAAELV